jgi:hypothetical protein
MFEIISPSGASDLTAFLVEQGRLRVVKRINYRWGEPILLRGSPSFEGQPAVVQSTSSGVYDVFVAGPSGGVRHYSCDDAEVVGTDFEEFAQELLPVDAIAAVTRIDRIDAVIRSGSVLYHTFRDKDGVWKVGLPIVDRTRFPEASGVSD